MFQGSLKGVHRKFHGCFKEVKGVLRKFQECFKEVSGKGRSVDYSTGSKLQGKKWKFQDEGVFHIEFISNLQLICGQI